MRKPVLLGAVLACLLGSVGVANAADAVNAVPTCLISDSGTHGRFTKTVICAELRNVVDGMVGAGRYSPGDLDGDSRLTVSVQYQPLGPLRPGNAVWLTLSSVTVEGAGELTATTRMVRPRLPGELRACASAEPLDGSGGRQVCTAA